GLYSVSLCAPFVVQNRLSLQGWTCFALPARRPSSENTLAPPHRRSGTITDLNVDFVDRAIGLPQDVVPKGHGGREADLPGTVGGLRDDCAVDGRAAPDWDELNIYGRAGRVKCAAGGEGRRDARPIPGVED